MFEDIVKNVVIDDIHKEYLECLAFQRKGNYGPMKQFIEDHKEEYNQINRIYHKRTLIKKNIACMAEMSKQQVYFGELTFDENHNESSVSNKRKQAIRFLNDLFRLWLLVEEYGEEKGRYHVHFVGVFEEGKGFEDFRKWHSRQQLRKVQLTNSKVRYVASYLCDYVLKQEPRLRRNKRLVQIFKPWCKYHSWKDYDFKITASKLKGELDINYIFDLDIEMGSVFD